MSDLAIQAEAEIRGLVGRIDAIRSSTASDADKAAEIADVEAQIKAIKAHFGDRKITGTYGQG